MADVDAPGRIREHLQHIAFGRTGSRTGAEALLRVPCLLPAGIGGHGVETPVTHFGKSVFRSSGAGE
jgi:hypothetical protein